MQEERYPYENQNKKQNPRKVQAKVVLARCAYVRGKSDNLFGIRIQKFGGDWFRTWAFKIDEGMARREGYDKERISGSFGVTQEYPGCPYCKTLGFVQCGACGKISCLKENAEMRGGGVWAVCQWCGQGGVATQVKKLNLQGGGF